MFYLKPIDDTNQNILKKIYETRLNADRLHHIELGTLNDQFKWYDTIKKNKNCFLLSFINKKEENEIGFIYIKDIDYINRNCILTYYIYEEKRGKGYGNEIIKHSIYFIFNTLGLKMIFIEILYDHIKSISAAKKCGFVETGIKHNAVFRNGKWFDSLIFEMENKNG